MIYTQHTGTLLAGLAPAIFSLENPCIVNWAKGASPSGRSAIVVRPGEAMHAQKAQNVNITRRAPDPMTTVLRALRSTE